MIVMKIISMMLIVTMLLQTVGCSTLRPLKTLNQTEIKPDEMKKRVSVRILLKPESNMPFKERRFTCKIQEINPDAVTVKVVGVHRFDTRREYRILISDIQEMEILERKVQKVKTLAATAIAGFLIFFAVSVASHGGATF
jgi:hypothetical protein